MSSVQTDRIRVMLVDDHAVVRSGLAAFLMAFDDLELVGEAGDGAEAVAMCARVKPDVVLMDLVMPEMDGATATRAMADIAITQALGLNHWNAAASRNRIGRAASASPLPMERLVAMRQAR